MSKAVFTSALGNLSPISKAISVEEVNLGMIDLRGDLGDKKFVSAVKKALGVTLPSKPRRSVHKNDVDCLWLSPDQWLITCAPEQKAALLSALKKALGSIHSLAVDVSHARCVLRLTGDCARETLMKGSSVDLSTKECDAGYVRRLLFAEQGALVHIRSQSPDIIDLFIFRSYADYVWKWLEVTSNTHAKVNLFTKQHELKI